MVRAAIKAEAQHPRDQASLFIDADPKEMLSLPEIKRLRGLPELPVKYVARSLLGTGRRCHVSILAQGGGRARLGRRPLL